MDWSHVSLNEILSSIRQAELTPRPLAEFCAKFTVPKSVQWASRAKCNLFYYRANYFALLVLTCVTTCFWGPKRLLAVVPLLLALACFNDPTATAINDQLLSLVKKVSPHTALRWRALNTISADSSLESRRIGRRRLHVLLLPRPVFCLVLALVGLWLLYVLSAVVSMMWALLLGCAVPIAHASLRSPNLKARLSGSEFKAVWRGYQADLSHDYTL